MTDDGGRETKECANCGGRGWLVPDNALEPGAPDNVTCPECNGDGFVYV